MNSEQIHSIGSGGATGSCHRVRNVMEFQIEKDPLALGIQLIQQRWTTTHK
jgi:hypothetical protein